MDLTEEAHGERAAAANPRKAVLHCVDVAAHLARVFHRHARLARRRLGASRLRLDGNGDLLVTLADGGTLVHHAPIAYQERDGRREPVDARSVLTGSDRIGFALAADDRARPVYIDPGLTC